MRHATILLNPFQIFSSICLESHGRIVYLIKYVKSILFIFLGTMKVVPQKAIIGFYRCLRSLQQIFEYMNCCMSCIFFRFTVVYSWACRICRRKILFECHCIAQKSVRHILMRYFNYNECLLCFSWSSWTTATIRWPISLRTGNHLLYDYSNQIQPI